MSYCLGEGHAPTYRERKPIGWTPAYHSNFNALADAVETILPIFTNEKLYFNMWAPTDRKTLQFVQGVKWIQRNSATAAYTVSAVGNLTWGSLWIDGTKVQDFDFRLGGGTVTGTADVTNLIGDGNHTFLFMADKLGINYEGPWTVTVSLILNGVFDTSVPFWENLLNWVNSHPVETASIAGGSLAAVGGVILMSKRGKRRR